MCTLQYNQRNLSAKVFFFENSGRGKGFRCEEKLNTLISKTKVTKNKYEIYLFDDIYTCVSSQIFV